MSSLRQRVLSLYRTALRLGRTWVASDPQETQIERDYIIQEARTLFRKNKHVMHFVFTAVASVELTGLLLENMAS